MEDPQPLAGARVVAADVALLVPAALRHAARQVRGADHDDVACAMIGVACRPMSPVSRSTGWSISSFRSTMPSLAEGAHALHRSARRARPSDSPASHRRCAPVCRRSSTPARVPTACAAPTSARLPSSRRCTQCISPVAASSATTARRVPAVVYRTPLTTSGVVWKLNSGRAPNESVLSRHATSSELKLLARDLIERHVARAAQIAAVGRPVGVAGRGLRGKAQQRQTDGDNSYDTHDRPRVHRLTSPGPLCRLERESSTRCQAA